MSDEREARARLLAFYQDRLLLLGRRIEAIETERQVALGAALERSTLSRMKP